MKKRFILILALGITFGPSVFAMDSTATGEKNLQDSRNTALGLPVSLAGGPASNPALGAGTYCIRQAAKTDTVLAGYIAEGHAAEAAAKAGGSR